MADDNKTTNATSTAKPAAAEPTKAVAPAEAKPAAKAPAKPLRLRRSADRLYAAPQLKRLPLPLQQKRLLWRRFL